MSGHSLDPRRVSRSDSLLSSVSVATLIAFDELEMLKLWKGLYLTMWHSDKPLVQVDLVVCQLVCMHVVKASVFIKHRRIWQRTLQALCTYSSAQK